MYSICNDKTICCRVHADCESENVTVVLFAVNLFAVATVKLHQLHHLPTFDCRVVSAGDAGEPVIKIIYLYVISLFFT